jgi:hypothetical protein
MMKINETWQELIDDKSFTHGLMMRRLPTSVKPDIFLAVTSPEHFKCLTISIKRNIPVDLAALEGLRDISVEVVVDGAPAEQQFIVFKLINNQHQDIFAVLCADLISSVSDITDDRQLLAELLRRFVQWQSLFDRAGLEALSPDEQQGLYGELYFLRKYLTRVSNTVVPIDSWKGPMRHIRDFQIQEWGLEVKTTRGGGPELLRISNERQLDEDQLETLVLLHLSVEVQQGSGESLNQIADEISKLLADDFTAQSGFKRKLIEAGYFDRHRSGYEISGYSIRNESFYEVLSNFPRVKEADLRKGVGDVKYSISVANLSDYKRGEDQVFAKLLTYE